MTSKIEIDCLLARNYFSLKETMKVINENGLGIAFIVDEEKCLEGIVTDGDIRRALLRGVSLETPISQVMNKNPITITSPVTVEKIESLVRDGKIQEKIPFKGAIKVPVLENNRVVDVLFISDSRMREGISQKVFEPVYKNEVKRVLILGGAGYLGSVLVRKLLRRGYKVKVLDNLIYGDSGIRDLYTRKDFEFIKGDVCNINDVIDAIKDIDAVVHLAAIVGDPSCVQVPKKAIGINYLATKALAEMSKYFQVNRFIFASTCSVYGASPDPDFILDEESVTHPLSLYAEMKLKAEQALKETADGNFSPTILRFGTLYGVSPRMRFDLVINLLTAQAIFDKRITVYGGSQWRPFVHVEDAAEAIIKCIKLPLNRVAKQTFNVVSSNLQIIDVGKKIKEKIPDSKIVVKKSVTDKRNYKVSADKITKYIEFTPKKTVEDGILEIKAAIDKGLFDNYNEKKYSNYLSISESTGEYA